MFYPFVRGHGQPRNGRVHTVVFGYRLCVPMYAVDDRKNTQRQINKYIFFKKIY